MTRERQTEEVIEMAYADRVLTCANCGNEFTFSAEDQEYHASRGYSDPRRCPSCRQARRETGDRGPSRGSSAPRRTYTVTCAECGQPAEVPFEPRGDRPVYCATCFARRSPPRAR